MPTRCQLTRRQRGGPKLGCGIAVRRSRRRPTSGSRKERDVMLKQPETFAPWLESKLGDQWEVRLVGLRSGSSFLVTHQPSDRSQTFGEDIVELPDPVSFIRGDSVSDSSPPPRLPRRHERGCRRYCTLALSERPSRDRPPASSPAPCRSDRSRTLLSEAETCVPPSSNTSTRFVNDFVGPPDLAASGGTKVYSAMTAGWPWTVSVVIVAPDPTGSVPSPSGRCPTATILARSPSVAFAPLVSCTVNQLVSSPRNRLHHRRSGPPAQSSPSASPRQVVAGSEIVDLRDLRGPRLVDTAASSWRPSGRGVPGPGTPAIKSRPASARRYVGTPPDVHADQHDQHDHRRGRPRPATMTQPTGKT